MKKILLFLLCFAILNAQDVQAAYYEDESNNGSSWENAYVLKTVEDFKLFRDRINNGEEKGKYYKLGSNIDLSSETDWAGINFFDGYFDGQSHDINVNISCDYLYTGLFENINNSSTLIKNLNVSGTVKGLWAGGFTWSLNAGTIENCSFSGTVQSASAWAGGFVDLMNGGTIKNCTFNGTVISATHSSGGIVAELVNGTVENCTVISGTSITAPSYAGGIIGLMHSGYVKNCSTDIILNDASSKGGIVGGATTSVITNLSGNKWPSGYTQIGLVSDVLPDDPQDIEKEKQEDSDKKWNKHTYKIFDEALTWEQAQARCETLGGHLLTITSEAEQKYVNEVLENSDTNYTSYWLGAKADESGWWHWVTDEVFEKQYENFADNQPDGSGSYLQITTEAGTWNDVANASTGFICEWDKSEETAETEIKAASNSSLFEQWQKDPSAWQNDSDTPTGARPSPEDTSHLANNPPEVDIETLPVSFDARTALPPVRDQGKYNTCWAFAALGAMEADYMAQKMTSLGNIPDLSELYLAWFVYKDASFDYPINHSVSNILDQAGTSSMAVGLLSKTPPVNESAMPYTTAGDDKTQTDSKIEAFLNNKNFTPSGIMLRETNDFASEYLSDENINVIKKMIMQHGAVDFTFMNVSGGYNSDKTNFYSDAHSSSAFHAALLVGWDDNYAAENFAVKPPKNGAWLVRNSYGEDFGDGGYFWMSYSQADTGSGMCDLRAFTVENDIAQLTMKDHDTNGKNKNITSAWSSVIFQSERDESLVRVAFYTTDNNASYDVYVNNFGKLKPTDPGKAEEALLSGAIPYAGYHTVDLKNPLKLYKGDYYSVIVKMTLASDYKYPTGVEASMDKYAIAVVEEGKSFFAEGDPVPSLWVDGHDATEGPFNACIKVFTMPRVSNETQPVILTSNLPDGYVGETYNFTLSSSGTETIEWRSGNIPSGFSLSRSGVLSGQPENAGEFDVKLTVFNDVGISETTLKLNVNDSSNNVSGSQGGCNFGFSVYYGVFALALFLKMRHKVK